MDRSNQYQLQQHLSILGWLLIVEHAILLLIAAFVFALLMGVGVVSGDREAMAVLSVVAPAVSALLVLLAVPGIVAGFAVLKGKSWGRYLAIAIGILGMINIPVGTLVGVYALFVLLLMLITDGSPMSIAAHPA